MADKMTPAELLAMARDLRSQLDGDVIPVNIKLQHEILRNMIEAYRLQLEYERARRQEGIELIAIFDGSGPLLNEVDAKDIREADSIRKEIAKKLRQKRA